MAHGELMTVSFIAPDENAARELLFNPIYKVNKDHIIKFVLEGAIK